MIMEEMKLDSADWLKRGKWGDGGMNAKEEPGNDDAKWLSYFYIPNNDTIFQRL